MGYRLVNIHTGDFFECDDSFWIEVLDNAVSNGWEGKGTTIDFVGDVEEAWDELLDYGTNLLRLYQIHMFRLEWNGSYLEKENQIVSDEDAFTLREYIRADGQSAGLLLFLGKGGFKISEAG